MSGGRWWLWAGLLLSGCQGDTGDLQRYLDQVHANPPPYQGRPRSLPHFEPARYDPGAGRSPFMAAPMVTTSAAQTADRPGCLGPPAGVSGHPLQGVALDSLVMRGTLSDRHNRWALLETADGLVHRVRKGDLVGIFAGRVVAVHGDRVELVERVEQGLGCYVERQARIVLVSQDKERL
ncbi:MULTISPECIES: pilus assembly protein PilP [Ferrimonas]|uniref:pilus assembly protein PilP n=1 Tax=Ferrimonas TaxID=44011 RepID=UPI00048891B5|nr:MULTISPECIES: pilus assembly protein PilP [Ferrimonas]USD37889.1 pilus assembly protein PilP [Ferrimonas sp. SCSIO 43195]